ncbi:MAG TPA: hypothetical protein VM470_10195 [Acidimicrobiia bacterium]|nr:hypothetical protein [Acidimicrobiia bacterium]
MALLSDWGFFVLPAKESEFRLWLRENEDLLTRQAPRGYQYLGTYKPVWRPETESAEFHQVWRYGDNKPPDMRLAAADTGGDFTELARQYLSFVDQSRQEEETFRLYKSVED